jgi:GTP-binding protein Era
MTNDQAPVQHSGFLALIGLPNAGKSTLMNALLEEKISIVSEKPQTTRKRVQGILTQGATQIIFVDTPGYIASTSGLNQFLISEFEDVLAGVDAIALLISADDEETGHSQKLKEILLAAKVPKLAIVTKADLKVSEYVVRVKDELEAAGVTVIGIRALEKPEFARTQLLPRFREMLPESHFLYDDEQITTHSIRELSAELIREKCFNLLQKEIPYGLGIRITKFDESDADIVRIYADIILEKDNHKSIVIGQKGQMLKSIGQAARLDIEKLVGEKVYLELHVAVKKNWTQRESFLKELGYEVKK